MDKKLNPEQIKAIEHGPGPLLIIAGAGTGKTTVITERIKYILKNSLAKPEEILALTFTEKAATEMEERVDKIMPYGYTQMWISTFHSFCDFILRQEGIAIGINPNFKLMTEADAILFLKKNLFKLNLAYFRPLGNPSKFLEALLQHFSRLRDEDIETHDYLKFAGSLTKTTKYKDSRNSRKIGGGGEEEALENKKTLELAHAYKQYSDRKLKEGALDFSDLIAETLNLFRTRKNILNEYRNKFKYILVDEFQDTNFAQNELAILMAGKKQNITVVADDDQAIYRWRGAALSNVIQFKNNFPGAKIITLQKNYRSTQEILNHAYGLIQNNNPNRLEVLENINKKLISERKIKGAPLEFIFKDRVDEEADGIAKKINNITRTYKYKYSDIAILVRANNHSHPITVALARNKIPYQFLGPGYLLQQDEVKNLIAYLKVLYNLDDSVSFYRILSMDIFDLAARDINALLSFAKKRNFSLFEALEKVNESFLSEESKGKIKKIVSMILKHLDRVKKDPPGQIVYYFLLDSGLLNSFLEIKTERQEKEAQNIAKFFDKIKTFETVNRDANIYSLVDWIDLMMELGDSPLVQEIDFKNVNAVNILTIHSSKGLEFPVVFMVNLVSDRFPTRERKEKIPLNDHLIKEIVPVGDHHLQEERRLFYVGMTRARDMLFMTAAKYYADGKREKKISPFVFEAIPELKNEDKLSKEIKQLSFLEAIRDYKDNQGTITQEQHVPFRVQTVSYSQLQAFDICPLHYKARFLLKLPTPATAPLSFGISIHAAFRDFYELAKKKKPNLDEFLSLLQKNWMSEGYQEKSYEKKMFELGEKIIKNYYKNFFSPKNIPLSLELPFSFYLNRDGNKNLPIKILGKMDRIDKIDRRKIEIIDYKTGNSETLSKKSYELQLGIYALAATCVDNEFLKRNPQDIKVSLFYLEEGKKRSEDITAERIEKVKQLILEKVAEIETSDFKCSGSILCQNCEYKMLCNAN